MDHVPAASLAPFVDQVLRLAATAPDEHADASVGSNLDEALDRIQRGEMTPQDWVLRMYRRFELSIGTETVRRWGRGEGWDRQAPSQEGAA